MDKKIMILIGVTIVLAALLFVFGGEMLSLVVVSGFVDGIHPCGFAVLLFFIGFLLSLQKSRIHILLMGAAYIFGVFITYLFIGLGIIQAASFFSPHFFAQFGSLLLVFVGLINIKDGLMGGATLRIPKFSKPWLQEYIEKATLPAAFISGLLVGLCAFPCAGGIYVAIISYITLKLSALEGLVYLVLYNFMFVSPMIVVLLLASNEKILTQLEEFEKNNGRKYKLVMGILMIALAVFILYSMGIFSEWTMNKINASAGAVTTQTQVKSVANSLLVNGIDPACGNLTDTANIQHLSHHPSQYKECLEKIDSQLLKDATGKTLNELIG